MFGLYKPPGATPLEALKEFKTDNPEHRNKKLGYAGRLDPLAEGVLLVLEDNELKNQWEYMNMDKEYVAEILFGFQTDSYDLLGVPTNRKLQITNDKFEIKKLEDTLKGFEGEFEYYPPPYSAVRVQGKPLFWWAKNNKLDEINIPRREGYIYKLEYLGAREIKTDKLLESIEKKVDSVQGDFRQPEIKKEWKSILEKENEEIFPLIKVRVETSRGVYIRSLAREIGKKLRVDSVLFDLKRTRVGGFTAEDSYVLQ